MKPENLVVRLFKWPARFVVPSTMKLGMAKCSLICRQTQVRCNCKCGKQARLAARGDRLELPDLKGELLEFIADFKPGLEAEKAHGMQFKQDEC